MSDNKITPEILELIRRTSTVKGCSNVYSLAPRGSRIGFYFQQRRATLLAAALHDRLKKENLRTANIAVIGAGVTGVTFFASLVNYGAENVHLYEASDDMCETGDNAPHRLVHPNYNRWPTLGSMDPFTSLPVLNWRAGSAEDVSKGLRVSIKNQVSETVMMDRFHSNHRCVEVFEGNPGHEKPVKVVFQEQNPERFQIVVLAAGFGEESCQNWDLIDYWTEEETPIEDHCHERQTQVFGTGDGALIDVFRCCARKPKAAWEIPLGLIGRLRRKEASILRKDAEQASQIGEVIFSEYEIQIQRHEEGIRAVTWDILKSMNSEAIDEYVDQEKKFYENFVKEMIAKNPTIKDFLEEKLKPATTGNMKPKLIGEFKSAYEPTSAPINKLLLAYLLITKRITYQRKNRARISEMLDEIKAKTSGEARQSISICRFGARRNYPPKTDSLVKHDVETDGEISEAGNVGLAADEVSLNVSSSRRKPMACPKADELENQLIDVLSGISGGEFVFYDAIPHFLNVRQNEGSLLDINDVTRAKFKYILQSFAEDHLGTSKIEYVRSAPDISPRWIVDTPMKQEDMMKSLQEIGGLDGVFIGAPIVVASKTVYEEVDF